MGRLLNLVYNHCFRSQADAIQSGVMRGVLKVFAVLMSMSAPVFCWAGETLEDTQSVFQGQEPSVLCQSFNYSRVQYHEALLAQRHADNRFANFQGMRIASIEFARVDVFDEDNPAENNSLYRLVNTLNMRTRKSAISPQLLFNVGDRLDPAAVTETERNLRARTYLADAYVMPVASCGGDVHLVVVTQDAWTTQPVLSASREGGRNESKFGLVEGNFLGTGSEISVIFKKTDDRSSLGYGFKKDYLFDKPLRIKFGYSDNSDGESHAFNFGKPFYTDATRWGFDVRLEKSDATQTIERNEQEIARYHMEAELHSAYTAWQFDLSSPDVWRLYSGVTQVQHQYTDFQGGVGVEPENQGDLLYPWLAIEKKSTQYIVLKNINYIEAVEDIRVGASWSATLGYSPEQKNGAAALIAAGEYQQIFASAHRVYEVAAAINSVNYEDASKSYFDASFGLNSWWLRGERHRVYASLHADVADPNAIHNAVSLGGSKGVRGYPAFFVLGNRSLSTTLEYRYHSGLHLLNILRVGFAAYADAGVLENTRFPIDNGGYDRDGLANVGLGMRITSSKTHVDSIVHIDIAKPIGYQKGAGDYQVLLRAEKRF